MADNQIKLTISAEDGATPALQSVEASLQELNAAAQASESDTQGLETALKRLGTSLEDIETGTTRFERALLAAFDNVANNSQASSEVISSAFDKALSKIKTPAGLEQLQSSLENLKASGKITEEQFTSLGKKLEETAGKAASTPGVFNQVKTAFDEVTKSAGKLAESYGLGGVIGSLGKFVNATTLGIGAIVGLGAEFFRVNLNAEKLNVELVNLTGSQEKATEAMTFAKAVAYDLGTNAGETAKTWIKYKDTLSALGLTTQQSQSFFKDLSHAVVLTGGSMGDLDGRIQTLRRAIVSGNLDSRQLSTAFGDLLPKAFDAAAKRLGMTNDQFGDFIKSGRDVNEILPIIQQGIKDAFGDYAPVQTLDANIQRLQITINSLLKSSDTHALDGLNYAVTSLTSGITYLSEGFSLAGLTIAYFMAVTANLKDYLVGNTKSLSEMMDKMKETDAYFTAESEKTIAAYVKIRNESRATADEVVSGVQRQSIAQGDARIAVDKTIEGFDNLKTKSELVSAALASIGKSVDFSKPKEAAGILVVAIEELRKKANVTDVEIVQGLVKTFDKLSDTQLAQVLNQVNIQLVYQKDVASNTTLQAALLNEQYERHYKIASDVNKIKQQEIATEEKAIDAKIRTLQAEKDILSSKGMLYTAAQTQIKIDELEIQKLREKQEQQQLELTNLQNQLAEKQRQIGIDSEHAQQLAAEINLIQQKIITENEEMTATQKLIELKNLQLQQEKQRIPLQSQLSEGTDRTTASTAQYTAATQQSTAAATDNANAVSQQGQSMDGTADIAAQLLNTQNTLANETAQLSEKTRDLYYVYLYQHEEMKGIQGAHEALRNAMASLNSQTAGGSDALSKYSTALVEANGSLSKLRASLTMAPNDLAAMERSMVLAAAEAKASFYAQAVSAEQLRLKLEEVASGTRKYTGDLVAGVRNAASEFDLLDEQDLAGLQSAIDKVNDKMVQMQEETQKAKSDLADLNAQLLEEKGETAAAERLRNQTEYNDKLIALEKQLTEAKSENNRDLIALYTEEINKLKELYTVKEQNLKQEEKEKASRATSSSTSSETSTTSTSSGTTSTKSSGTTYNIHITGSGGTSADVESDDYSAVEKLIKILKNAGLTVTSS